MKTFERFPILLFLLLGSATFAQDDAPRSLIGADHQMSHGGWGAPTATYTRINDQDAMLVGARGGWLIDHRVTLGLAGHGLVTPVKNAAYDQHLVESGRTPYNSSRLQAGYGGLLIEPIIAYRSPVHVSLPIIIGAGGCGYSYSSAYAPHGVDYYDNFDDVSAFFVVEPGVDLEVTLVPLVRLAVGASYRYTSDVDLPATSKDVLRGFNAGFSIKVGRF